MDSERVDWPSIRTDGWQQGSAAWISGMTLFLSVTGLTVFLLPFSVFNQHAVVVHTILGLIYLPPLALYVARHVRTYWDYPLTHTKFTGWASGALLAACVVSGVALTWEAALGTRISTAWRLVHQVTTIGTLLFLVPHLAAIAIAERKRRETPAAAVLVRAAGGHFRRALLHCGVALAAVAALSAAVRPVAFQNDFPADYELDPYGKGPFAPSLARTVSGGAFDERSLSDSATCGTAGCHEQIYSEWLPSVHRYAAMDVGFQAIQNVMAEQNGPVSTRYCAGCHDPISLFSGTKFIGVEQLTALHGYQEGVSCLGCHAIQQTDVKGNANYVIAQPERYVYELRDGGVAAYLRNFLLRAYPDHHVQSLSRKMFKTPEFCAACHKQFIDQEVNKVGWVQLQNQYDNWKASRWNHPGEPNQTLECRECHMPLAQSRDPAAGDSSDFNRTTGDGKHRSHRFLGANQFIPRLMKLEGGEEHAALTERWLRGEIEIPEIADRWKQGPVVPIELNVPAEAIAGTAIPIRVHMLNNKAGHDFPTGPLDIIQAWVELEVTDDKGAVVFRSGAVDDANFIDTGTFMFKAEPVDRYGNLIDRHNLWEMVGVRFKRSLFPGAADVASYDVLCPSGMGGEGQALPREEHTAIDVPEDARSLTVSARLCYRKFDQYLLNFALGSTGGLTAPITEMSRASAQIRVVAPREGG